MALLTDFGSRDWYVAAMKGVLLSECPDVTIVDIAHDLTPFDVRGASLCLYGASATFPPGTVFLCVVDPGVGTKRRAMCATDGERHFVGPDNGVFTLPAAAAERQWLAHELVNPHWRRHPVANTFHGRDIFAPAAARLAAGAALGEAGPVLAGEVRFSLGAQFSDSGHRRAEGELLGEVFYIDRYGNLITSIHKRDLTQYRETGSPSVAVQAEGAWVAVDFGRTFGDVAVGQPVAYWGSAGFLEIAVNQRDASAELAPGIGAIVRLRL